MEKGGNALRTVPIVPRLPIISVPLKREASFAVTVNKTIRDRSSRVLRKDFISGICLSTFLEGL